MKSRSIIVSTLVFACALLPLGFICQASLAQTEPPLAEHVLEQLSELKGVIEASVEDHPKIMTVTNTMQQANALYNKIDAAATMVQEGSFRGASNILGNDISPKLNICETVRARALSWLSEDPLLQDAVQTFEGICQSMIEDILIDLNRLMDQPK